MRAQYQGAQVPRITNLAARQLPPHFLAGDGFSLGGAPNRMALSRSVGLRFTAALDLMLEPSARSPCCRGWHPAS